MGCSKTRCIVCNGVYIACQLVDGKCNTCFMASQTLVTPENNIVTPTQIIETVQEATSNNNIYYS